MSQISIIYVGMIYEINEVTKPPQEVGYNY